MNSEPSSGEWEQISQEWEDMASKAEEDGLHAIMEDPTKSPDFAVSLDKIPPKQFTKYLADLVEQLDEPKTTTSNDDQADFGPPPEVPMTISLDDAEISIVEEETQSPDGQIDLTTARRLQLKYPNINYRTLDYAERAMLLNRIKSIFQHYYTLVPLDQKKQLWDMLYYTLESWPTEEQAKIINQVYHWLRKLPPHIRQELEPREYLQPEITDWNRVQHMFYCYKLGIGPAQLSTAGSFGATTNESISDVLRSSAGSTAE